MKKQLVVAALLAASAALVVVPGVSAITDCTFTTSGTTMSLDGDCTTDATIPVPDGFTLDGNNHTITAVDPGSGHFLGAVVANVGATAHVERLTIVATGLANVCDGGADRLRGIMFEGASGSITHNTIDGLNQGASGCQEGNAIEVRNGPFDGTHPDLVYVEVAHNTLNDWQKTGIVANGDVNVNIHHNDVNESATQDNLAANGIQLGFGALGSATHNNVEGNQWKGTTNWGATAILVFDAGPVEVSLNNVRGNSDVGLYIVADGGTYNNNRVLDEGPDDPNAFPDFGVVDDGSGNSVTNNKSRGFEFPYYGVTGGRNKTIPGPQVF